ncbi:hypothetical protein C8Q70DRAFT_1058352 [Cubamyces menziesii]|nr:hypothetical protein C8Q70DRAFT_1058352 [Cubamyces menziesii]
MTGGEADELAPPQGPVYREAVIAREAYYATRLSWGFIPSLRTLSFFIPIFEDLSTVHQEIALTPPSRIVDAAMSSSDSDLHLYCPICLSLFLSDVEKEAQTVATTCGHIYHRDCAEGLLKSQCPPRCVVCQRALPANPKRLRTLFMAYDETPYDRELLKAVRDATASEDHSAGAVAAEAECREKIEALREEQAYNEAVIAALDAQWIAIEKLNDAAQKRVKDLEEKLAKSEKRLHDVQMESTSD